MIESELFGHIQGAFTGANRAREGVFRQASHGTLFLDEIGDMPVAVQTRLLRVLQEGVVQPVGSEECITVDVRIISATHQDLEQSIDHATFRQDLYFRLKGIELYVPPLRSRREDILLLAKEFLNESSSDVDDEGPVETFDFSSEAVTSLINHNWPGNVRELQQMMRSATALADGKTIGCSDLGLTATVKAEQTDRFDPYLDLPLTAARSQLVEDFERAATMRATDLERGNVSAAARRLGVHRQTLQQKMKQLGLR